MEARIPDPLASAPGGEAGDGNVLLVGDDLARVDRFVPTIRRVTFSIRRVLTAPAAAKLVRANAYDLVVVVLPLLSAREVLRAIRAEGSPCRWTAVLVIADEGTGPDSAEALGPQGNRVLPAACSPEEVQAAVELLLRAAPRVEMRGTARLHLDPPRTVQVENLSTTGMLLMGSDPPAVGSVFGFELLVASLNTPVRGQARVVRHAGGRKPGEHGIAVNFVSLGGEGALQLESLIFHERAAAGAEEWRTGPQAARSGVIEIRDAEELAVRREELAELSPYLEGLLRQGLAQRVRSAEWYVAAAELGLESLRWFSGVLQTVHGGRTTRREVSQQLIDLGNVSRSLENFGQQPEVETRVQILLGMRFTLARLLREIALTGTQPVEGESGTRQHGLVAQLAQEIGRLLRSRKQLGDLPPLIEELGRFRYSFARRARARRVDEIRRGYAGFAAELGLVRESLLTRRGRRDSVLATHREIRRLEERIASVHRKIYTGRFRGRASGDLEVDLSEEQLTTILGEILSAGAAFLVRAYSAYRHALELTGSDVRLLDRVAGLAAAITVAEERLERKRRPNGALQAHDR